MKYQNLLNTLKKHTPHAAGTMDHARLVFTEFYTSSQKDAKVEVEKTYLTADVPAYWITHLEIKPRIWHARCGRYSVN